MAQVVVIIQKVIDALKEFVNKLEKSSGALIQSLETYAAAAGQKILSESKTVFNSIKNSIENEIKAMTTRIESLKSTLGKSSGKIGKSGTGIMDKLGVYVKDFVKDVEKIGNDFVEMVHKFVEQFKTSIERISRGIYKFGEESFESAEKFAQEAVQKIKGIGSDAYQGLSKSIGPVKSEFSSVENFIHKHSLEVSEAAVASFVEPVFALACLMSAGFLIFASKY